MCKEKPLFIIKKGWFILIDCEFIITPRILFNDKNLSRSDIDVLSLIISRTFKYGYCYSKNSSLADYVKLSERSITYSLSKLKELNYIIVKYVDNQRRIYLNKEKIPIKSSSEVATGCYHKVEDNCDHNINNKYKKEYKRYNFKEPIIPKWMKKSRLM